MNIWIELASLVSPTVALTAAVGWWWRRKVRPFMADQMVALVEQRLANAIVTRELTPNGGGSIKDLVSQIRPNHAEAQRHWMAIETQMAANSIRLTAIEDREKLDNTLTQYAP